MKHHPSTSALVEPMVDARHAARALNLPFHYFLKPASRRLHKIPHYRIGRTVRFRLSELQVWSARFRQRPKRAGAK